MGFGEIIATPPLDVATAALLRRRCVCRARQAYGREAKCRAQSCNGTVPCHVVRTVAHRGNAVVQAIEHVAYIRLLVVEAALRAPRA
jgi:hypothetical protein